MVGDQPGGQQGHGPGYVPQKAAGAPQAYLEQACQHNVQLQGLGRCTSLKISNIEERNTLPDVYLGDSKARLLASCPPQPDPCGVQCSQTSSSHNTAWTGWTSHCHHHSQTRTHVLGCGQDKWVCAGNTSRYWSRRPSLPLQFPSCTVLVQNCL